MARPFLKWAGGKRKLLEQLVPLLPLDVVERRYLEPFVGGGSMFFHLEPKSAILSDANPDLMTTYLAVQNCVEEVIEELTLLAATHQSAETYYAARDLYNAGSMSLVSKATLFIYLNRLCFNGLYRVNKSGGFNVPYGKYKNPRICDPEGLRTASEALQRAQLEPRDFHASLVFAELGDFVYFDPPYAPLSATSNFVAYTEGGFGTESQNDLREVFERLHERGCKLLLSNSDTPELRQLYRGFQIHEIQAPRAINANGAGRGNIGELAICNY